MSQDPWDVEMLRLIAVWDKMTDEDYAAIKGLTESIFQDWECGSIGSPPSQHPIPKA